jgi:hypothetical protein
MSDTCLPWAVRGRRRACAAPSAAGTPPASDVNGER